MGKADERVHFSARPTETGFTLAEQLPDGGDGEPARFTWKSDHSLSPQTQGTARYLVKKCTGSPAEVTISGNEAVQDGRTFRIVTSGEETDIYEVRQVPPEETPL